MKCSRTACKQTEKIVCRHTHDGRMYCVPCARKINEHNTPGLGLVHIPPMVKLWIVDDDEYYRTAISEDFAEALPLGRAKAFKDLFETRDQVSGPDILIVDISAVSPVAAGSDQAYSPICGFHEHFPGCTIYINFAVAKVYAEDVQALVKERCPECDIRLICWDKCDPFKDIRRIFKELADGPATANT